MLLLHLNMWNNLQPVFLHLWASHTSVQLSAASFTFPFLAAIVSTAHLCTLVLKHHLHEASKDLNTPSQPPHPHLPHYIYCTDPPLKLGVELQVTKYAAELSGLSMVGPGGEGRGTTSDGVKG